MKKKGVELGDSKANLKANPSKVRYLAIDYDKIDTQLLFKIIMINTSTSPPCLKQSSLELLQD
ncbi:putative sigma 32 [Lyngbya aestuarii BL J]|uniref:Putative sigma 32 n=1 Tax=Lyngbya aestuarii BL J TaxID=1348334 RepID=U7QR80_9CYAN|nr:putative sigma 32 [Lyngbya aestuarii BL J]